MQLYLSWQEVETTAIVHKLPPSPTKSGDSARTEAGRFDQLGDGIFFMKKFNTFIL